MITSSSNDLIKHIKKLQTKKSYRYETGQFVIEGIKMVRDGSALLHTVIAAESFDIGGLQGFAEERLVRVSDRLLDQISDTATPQGVLAVADMKTAVPDELLGPEPFLLFCDGVSDPGNLGTIIRTADAAGCDGVILSSDCADLYNPKTIRSTMSSLFHIKICRVQDSIKTLEFFKTNHVTIAASALDAKDSIYETDLRPPIMLVVGNEANGICESVLTMSHKYVKIPMSGNAESLNVGVAAALLLYESVRQRQGG